MVINKEHKTKKFSSGINKKQYIMAHHTGPGSNEAQLNYLCYNKAEISCHYIIYTNGDIYQIADDNKITRHAGKGNWKGITTMNQYAIGIEIVSDGITFTNEQRESYRFLVKKLMNEYNISSENHIRHKDYAPLRKNDVSDKFWNDNYLSWDKYKDSYNNKKFIITDKKDRKKLDDAKNMIRQVFKKYVGTEPHQLLNEASILITKSLLKK